MWATQEGATDFRVCHPQLEQSEMIGILGLQRAHQDFKRRKLTQIFEVRVLQKKRPARESTANTSLQPLEGSFASSQQGKYAGNLMVSVVRMSEGFWTRTRR